MSWDSKKQKQNTTHLGSWQVTIKNRASHLARCQMLPSFTECKENWLFSTTWLVVINLVNQTCKLWLYNFMRWKSHCRVSENPVHVQGWPSAKSLLSLISIQSLCFAGAFWSFCCCLFRSLQFLSSLERTVISKGHFWKPAQLQVFVLVHFVSFVL